MKVVFAAALLLSWVGCTIARQAAQSELVFRGTVTMIESGVTGDLFKRFVVTTRVDKVLKGSFAGSQFQFAVHSPANSGLDIGKQYTIRAIWTGAGYMVDDLQWLHSAQATR